MSDTPSSPEIGELMRRNHALADQLLALTSPEDSAPPPAASSFPDGPQQADAIVAHIEVNSHHGVGVLLQRLFGDGNNIISFRSKNFYVGRQEFGAMHVCVSHPETSRDAVIANVLESLRNGCVRRILAVPYFADDVLTALALKAAFGVPLCVFLMDDQNLHSDGIPDSLMEELLRKSSLRLAISPQMRDAYEKKYHRKIWFMPPLAPSRLIPSEVNQLPSEALAQREPLILGNIWGARWLELLRKTVRGSNVRLRWFNNGVFPTGSCSKEELERDGIYPQTGAADPDDVFVKTLREAPFIVVPSGTLDASDDRRFIAQLSFPSRIPYILATSHTPILVLGNSATAAAEVVRRLGIGADAPYDASRFLEAVEWITRPEVNAGLRRTAFVASNRFADLGAAEWIWQSLAKGEPIDGRYEDLAADLTK